MRVQPPRMLRRTISACCAAAFVLLGPAGTRAAPPTSDSAAAPAPIDVGSNPEAEANERVDRAIEAWRRGDWTDVRDLLEPLVREGEGIRDDLLRESALRYLAEATLLDDGLETTEREELARGYIIRLLDTSREWSPPSGLHSRVFLDLVTTIRSERDSLVAEGCLGELLACKADLSELRVDHDQLARDYASQDVAVRDIIKRNRGLALIPLGVGHFTNDNYALGGTFLALEVTTGIAALSLLVYRVRGLGCVRTNGFAPGSVVCPIENQADQTARQDLVENVRNAEIVMGYLFLGSIVLDIVVGQALFKPITVVDRGTRPRNELERETDAAAADGGARRKRPQPSATLELRPTPIHLQRGLGFGVHLRF
jgi:hypothetical protein